jgi:uncharacterized protein DUF2505
MKLNESFSYSGSDVESVYALITDQAFRTESCANQGSMDYTVTVEPNGDGATVTVIRTQEADLPDFVKKLTGSTVKVKQTEVWSGPGGDGSRTADVKVSIIGQPAEMVGKATLSATGDGSEFELNGDVKVSIPFIGKKIEPEIAKAITLSLREEVAYGMERL